MKKVVCFGPGPMFKGGIANYNTALAKALANMPDTEVHIVSWTQQYPAIIPRDFVDRSSKSSFLEGTNIEVTYLTNYNKPGTWKETYEFIKSLNPDKVVFQWAIALQGLPMGRIARMLKKNTDIEVIFDVHVLVQKEASVLDKYFTRYGLEAADTYVVHAYKTAEELQATLPKLDFVVNESGDRASGKSKSVIKLYHPVYNLFQPDPNFDLEGVKKEMGLQENVFLYFGFIRKYKGLHNVIPAFAKVLEQRKDVSLLIVGESFWNTLDSSKWSTKLKQALFGTAKKLFLRKSDDERQYNPLALVDELGIQDHTVIVNEFVPNEEVHRYFQVSDAILTYYLTATPSGVESLAYNFEMPVLATNVGHFPETVKDGFNGYLAEPENIDSMAEQMLKFIDHPIDRANVAKAAETMSWENYAEAIMKK
ncbi:glycosyltransferase [Pontibacter sp. G13]|uniref:glycosyltransferase n=1 Tax=Pontibacter sp. G13 TaxID=3074898 RepID=UPI00288BFC55|nr:glycosyltransferase [Pontibacter sp. G13]WNJ19465.1 glycosyltransferase [Pontibacter sp. G13]